MKMTESITPTTPYLLDSAFPIIPGNNRLERAMDILKHPKNIKKVGKDTYTVKSQFSFGTYVVTLGDRPKCTCPDYMSNRNTCKHIIAVREKLNKYSTHWSDYNLAQTTEGTTFPELLKELVSTIQEPEYKFGRPSAPLSDLVFCAVMKAYLQKSARRSQSALDEHLEQTYHFNTVIKTLNREDVTSILIELVRLSASPLAQIEHDFAIDSSGFATTKFNDWCNQKHKLGRKHQFVKCHISSGVYSNIVADVIITPESGEGTGDVLNFCNLLDGTTGYFDVRQVSADRGYLSNKNYAKAESLGVDPYILFKKNSRASGCKAWNKAFRTLITQSDDWLSNYHKRSNVELTFGAIKSKFGETLRGKNYTSLANELLCRIIAYNITVLIEMAIKDSVDITFEG
jgi:transposase